MKIIKEKIILAITQDMKIYESFVTNLEFLNFEVLLICNNKKQKYKNIFHRINNLFRKIILNDKKFKKILFQKYELEQHLENLNQNQNEYNKSLTIRADLFDNQILEKIIQKSTKNYCYHWDGLSRFEGIENKIELFDKFYVFDKIDLKSNTFPTTNFYFDCYNHLFENKEPEYDAYFIGSYDSRIDTLVDLCEFLLSKNLKLNIILCTDPKKVQKKYPFITYIKKPFSYYENLKMIANCKMIIDLHHETLHNGLSFRSFEALGYDKKLITTNKIIKNYDFYNPNNIYLLNNNESEFNDFLNSEYQEIKPEIKFKYSFTNWINYIFEKENAIKINIPS